MFDEFAYLVEVHSPGLWIESEGSYLVVASSLNDFANRQAVILIIIHDEDLVRR